MKTIHLFMLLFLSSFSILVAQELPPWELDPECNSIMTYEIAAVTCGATEDIPNEERFTFGLINLNSAIPNAGRIDQTLNQEVYHHPSWHVDSLGNVFGISTDNCGNVYTTASANYSTWFFSNNSIIKYGGIPESNLEAAGAIYLIDGATGQASVFASLPQQSSQIHNMTCEGIGDLIRQTGPGLGNIAFNDNTNQFYVTNFEDGRIYRLDQNGVILDSYDPLVYDDGEAGMSDDLQAAYGIDIHEESNRVFFGTPGRAVFENYGGFEPDTLFNFYGQDIYVRFPKLYSIDLNPDGSFAGGINNTTLPLGATWDNYVGEELLHWEGAEFLKANLGFFSIPSTFSFSDLEFMPEDAGLLIGFRKGCGLDLYNSYNHIGSSYHLSDNGGVYNKLEGEIFSTWSNGRNDAYGGVSSFIDANGDIATVVSSSDMLAEQGPHGISVQHAGSYGDGYNGASPAAIISYNPILDQDYDDPKGFGGDVFVYKGCFCAPPCQDSMDLIVSIAVPSDACPGDSITLTANVQNANFVFYEWSTGDSTQSIGIEAPESDEYSVTVTDTCGFSGSATIVLEYFCCEDPLVSYNLDDCLASEGETSIYAEFEPEYPCEIDCGEISSTILYREPGGTHRHSCTPGVEYSVAICVGSLDDCDYDPGNDHSLIFETTINPGGESIEITSLSFHEKAPLMFDWINGDSGPNDYPTLYGIRILRNGSEVFVMSDLATTNDWTLEEFDFSGDANFIFEDETVLRVELLSYCRVDNGADVAAWDIDQIELYGDCSGENLLGDVGGNVLLSTDKDLAGVSMLLLDADDEMLQISTTNDEGIYSFNNVRFNEDYSILPVSNNDVMDGISTKDLVDIQKHLLGRQPFDSPYQFIAADVDASGTISGLDMIALRKLLLGEYTEFPSCDAWVFADKSQELNEDNFADFRENILLNQLETSSSNEDFIAVKMGDVDRSLNISGLNEESESRSEIQFDVETKSNSNSVIISYNGALNIDGFQFELESTAKVLSASSTGIDFSDSNMHQIGKQLRIVFADAATETGSFDIELTFEESTQIDLVTENIDSRVYAGNTEYPLVLRQIGDVQEDLEFSCAPNPVKNEAMLSFFLNSDAQVNLNIYNSMGISVSNLSGNYTSGNNIIRVDATDYVAGFYIAVLSLENQEEKIKFLISK